MIKFYNTVNNVIKEVSEYTEGTWISVVAPKAEEIGFLLEELKLDAGFVRSSLDEEESSRMENEDDQTLIILDYPVNQVDEGGETVYYYTMPMGIIVTKHNIITISLRDNNIIDKLATGSVKNINTEYKTKFVLQILFSIATHFLTYLKQIDKQTTITENQLHKTMKNKELIQLLNSSKSLVYFSTSLRSNQITVARITRGTFIKLYEQDEDLLEDVKIEINQAIEMAKIYTQIINSMTDSISSIINNNLNNVMKNLTMITVLSAIPTIIYSFFGMNVEKLPFTDNPLFAFILSLICTIIVAFFITGFLFRKKK